MRLCHCLQASQQLLDERQWLYDDDDDDDGEYKRTIICQ